MPDITTFNGIDMADIASINGQDAPSGGGAASTAPLISVTGGTFGAVTVTVSNHATAYTNPNYSVVSVVGATTTVADSTVDHLLDTGSDTVSGVMTFVDSNAASGTRTVSVRAQEFGDYIQSAAATATYDVTAVEFEYLRFVVVTETGAATTQWGGFTELSLWEGTGASGARHPAANMTSNTGPSSNDMEVLTGHVYNTSYAAWKGMDGSTGTHAWWPLSSAANNYYQIQFTGTVPAIASFQMRRSANDKTGYVRLLGSDTGSFAGEETDFGIFGQFVVNTDTIIG
tara:strand:+ start:30311 stop:31168 length:858 start_codon:yes stop_codon:yes gene_type:complete